MDNPSFQLPLSGAEVIPAESQPSPERPDPDNPPWGIWGALLLLVSSFILMALAESALVFGYALSRGVPLLGTDLAAFIKKDPGAIVSALVGLIVAHVLTLVPAWLIVTRVGRYPFLQTLGWSWSPRLTFWRSTWLALLLLLTGYSIIYATGAPENEFERILKSSRAAALVAAFAATFTAPLIEEIVFRGLLYPALRRLAGAAWAVTLVFLLFAVIHVPQYWPSFGVLAAILLLSFALTLVRARTGKLLPCFYIHFIFNGIQALLIVLGPYIDPFFDKTPVPDPGLLVGLLLRICGAAG